MPITFFMHIMDILVIHLLIEIILPLFCWIWLLPWTWTWIACMSNCSIWFLILLSPLSPACCACFLLLYSGSISIFESTSLLSSSLCISAGFSPFLWAYAAFLEHDWHDFDDPLLYSLPLPIAVSPWFSLSLYLLMHRHLFPLWSPQLYCGTLIISISKICVLTAQRWQPLIFHSNLNLFTNLQSHCNLFWKCFWGNNPHETSCIYKPLP